MVCAGCGGPLTVPVDGSETGCSVCGDRCSAAPLRLGELSALPSPADDQVRLDRLKQQPRYGSPYDLSRTPESCSRFEHLEAEDAACADALHQGFLEARKALLLSGKSAAGGGGAYRKSGRAMPQLSDQERAPSWIARRALEMFITRGEPVRARPLLEQAYELSSDPTWRQLALCDLSRMAIAVGESQTAERWLSGCDPQPDELELDSAYRWRRGALEASHGAWAEVLLVAGEPAQSIPVSRAAQVPLALLRMAALERLDRQEDADQVLAALVDEHLVVDIKDAIASDESPSPCRDCWDRLVAEWEKQADRKRRKGIQAGLIWGGAGLIAIPLAVITWFSGEMNTLVCHGHTSCHILVTLAGSKTGVISVTRLLGADVLTTGSGKNERSELILKTGTGPVELSTCSKCASDLQAVATKIDTYVAEKSLQPLTVTELGENPLPWIAIGFGMFALALLALGLGRIFKAWTHKWTPP